MNRIKILMFSAFLLAAFFCAYLFYINLTSEPNLKMVLSGMIAVLMLIVAVAISKKIKFRNLGKSESQDIWR